MLGGTLFIMQSKNPEISVIIIARNQKDTISMCLESVLKLEHDNYEVIVVDDCSEDGTAAIAEKLPVQLIRLDKHQGAASARNRGAECACGETLFFLDSDVVVEKNALSQIASAFHDFPSAQAVQGVYTRDSMPKNLVTRYRDYFDDYKNQGVESDLVKVVSTYCFAIKKQVFSDLGGFDARIPQATVEDNDLGYRLFTSGHTVVRNRHLAVTHLKSYSLKSLLKRDYIVSFNMVKFFLRAKLQAGWNGRQGIPLSSGEKTNATFAASIALSFGAFIFGILWALSGFTEYYAILFLALMLALILINSKFLFSLVKARGWRFCFVWVSIFYLDMLIASLGLVSGGIDFFVFKRRY